MLKHGSTRTHMNTPTKKEQSARIRRDRQRKERTMQLNQYGNYERETFS